MAVGVSNASLRPILRNTTLNALLFFVARKWAGVPFAHNFAACAAKFSRFAKVGLCNSSVRRVSSVALKGSEMSRLPIRVFGCLVAVCLCMSAGHAADPTLLKTAFMNMSPRAVVVALDAAAFSSDLNVAAREIRVREGMSFAEGDTLVVFDCRKQVAEWRAAAAVTREASLNLKSNAYLQKRGATGSHELQVSRARYEKSKAEEDVLQAQLSQCTIKAPFAGSVVTLALKRFERPEPGKPFLEIVSHKDTEIEMIVPSPWLSWLKPGQTFAFEVDELNAALPGKVMRIGAVVDAVSQTVKIYGELTQRRVDLKVGMSGTVRFKQPRS